jgi:quaternary ammonium compound-resistance protein SugE
VTHTAAWALLIVAGLFETAWAIGLKYTDGFTRLGPSVFTVATLIVSMLLLAYAVRVLPIGTAYAVWVGIGALGAAALGIALFQEPLTAARAGFLLLLLVSIAGLRMTSQG